MEVVDIYTAKYLGSLTAVEGSALNLSRFIRLEDIGENKKSETIPLLFTIYLVAACSRSSASLSLTLVLVLAKFYGYCVYAVCFLGPMT